MISRYLATVTLLLFTYTASAGGLYLREYGQPAQGTSGAGNTVLAEDASTAFLNQAGVFKLESDSEWMATGIVLDSSVKFDADSQNTISGNNGGDAGDTLLGAALFHARQLNDKWGFTFSLNSVAGSALDYDDDFVGRYTGQETELLTITSLPSVAYKINDELSIAAGIGIIYGELELKQAIPNLRDPANGPDGQIEINDGDDVDFTPVLSAMWEPTENWRFGLSYIGESELDFEGDLDVTLPINPPPPGGTFLQNIATDVDIVLPQRLELGSMYTLNDEWSLLASVAWEEWSELENVPISTNRVGIEIPLNWDDVWSIGVGARYEPNDRWTWYGGIAYDSDPASTEDQISILPADEQWRYSAGATYEINDSRQIGGVLTYIDLGDARIRNDLGDNIGTFSGSYDTFRLVVLGLNFNWR